MQQLLWWAFTLRIALCDCHNERANEGFKRGKSLYKVSQLGQLPEHIRETSGLVLGKTSDTFWTHNDSGNPPELYEVTQKGEVISTLKLPHLKNTDWEDLAKDNQGNFYIADVGNNQNKRRDLQIYKVNQQAPQSSQTIRLKYADQKAYPPAPNERNFDCEALTWHQGMLYLFSKNRSESNRFVKLYALPDKEGSYEVAPIDSVYSKAMVTAADISPDGNTLALLTYGKVLLFDISQGLNFQKPLLCIKIAKGQAEALAFVTATDFVITNEGKGKMYLVKKKKKN